MKANFYDLKNRKKVELEVTRKFKREMAGRSPQFLFSANTDDGRKLTTMTSKAVYESASDVQEVKA